MAMDAVPFDLLRSSLDSLKLRFQAANDPDVPSKAWLLHVHDRGDEKPAIYARADGYNSPSVKSSPSTWSQVQVPAIGRGFKRVVQLKGYQRLEPICEDAARLLDALPADVQGRLWNGLPEGTRLTVGLGLWVLVVFELGNANVGWSPLRCNRKFPISGEQAKTIFAPKSGLPADADWYATLPDFAAASVQAIDILQSWLADVPKQVSEAAGDGGTSSTPATKLESDEQGGASNRDRRPEQRLVEREPAFERFSNFAYFTDIAQELLHWPDGLPLPRDDGFEGNPYFSESDITALLTEVRRYCPDFSSQQWLANPDPSVLLIEMELALERRKKAEASVQGGAADGGTSSTPALKVEAVTNEETLELPDPAAVFAYRAAEYARSKTPNQKLTVRQIWLFWTDPQRGLANEDRDDFPELVGYDPGEYSTFASQHSRAKNHPMIDGLCYGDAKRKDAGGSVVRFTDV